MFQVVFFFIRLGNRFRVADLGVLEPLRKLPTDKNSLGQSQIDLLGRWFRESRGLATADAASFVVSYTQPLM